MVFVAGIGMLADAGMSKEGKRGRRASYIAMFSLCLGVGVALEPQIFDAGVTSPSAFYHTNAGFNYGLWPKHLTCDTPRHRVITKPATCTAPQIEGVLTGFVNATECAKIGGTFTAAVPETIAFPYCSNDNGMCCAKWNKGLKTLYCIAPLVCLLLNAIIPQDADDEDSGKKASS